MQSISVLHEYGETAYHLPISFALTGIDARDRTSAQVAYIRASQNPIIAAECLLSEKTGREGKEPSPYTVPGDTIRSLYTHPGIPV